MPSAAAPEPIGQNVSNPLARAPLVVGFLKVASGHVVEWHHLGHVGPCVLLGYVSGALSDDQSDLTLVVDAAHARGQENLLAWPEDRRRRLKEDEGSAGTELPSSAAWAT